MEYLYYGAFIVYLVLMQFNKDIVIVAEAKIQHFFSSYESF